MKLFLDCIPCLLRQTLDSSRAVTDDPAIHEKILREVLAWCATVDLSESSPVIASRIHRRLRELSGVDDPYAEAKAAQNQMALKLMPQVEQALAEADDPLELSVRLAIAGNIIDLGVKGSIEKADVHESIRKALESGVDGDFEEFRAAVERAESILYLADNAGEIVFDRLLLERLPREKITLAVRGYPVINDVTMADAIQCKITELVKVVDNGSDAPGTVLSECSAEFREIFAAADLIISKGQGNFETLNEVEANIFFLFKVKCPMVAEQSGMKIGSQVLMHQSRQQRLDALPLTESSSILL
ncbi:MAG: ARMT1-like domain-containing protein [Kiritimatiellia bacterium]